MTMAAKNGNNYETTLKLAYDEGEHGWKVGPYRTSVILCLHPKIEGIYGIYSTNAIMVILTNNGHNANLENFTNGFDSMLYKKNGRMFLYEKFEDAYAQLEKNKVNVERLIDAHIDISVLQDLKPIVLDYDEEVGEHSMASKNDGNYETTLKLAYDVEKCTWKIGPYPVFILVHLLPRKDGIYNTNYIKVVIFDDCYNMTPEKFIGVFDNIGTGVGDKAFVYERYEEAYAQLEKNKAFWERRLHVHIDISVLKAKKPIVWKAEEVETPPSLLNTEQVKNINFMENGG
jgi:hypothetical protein